MTFWHGRGLIIVFRERDVVVGEVVVFHAIAPSIIFVCFDWSSMLVHLFLVFFICSFGVMVLCFPDSDSMVVFCSFLLVFDLIGVSGGLGSMAIGFLSMIGPKMSLLFFLVGWCGKGDTGRDGATA